MDLSSAWRAVREFFAVSRPDKAAVGYIDQAAGIDDCSRCSHYRSQAHRCGVIRGRVSPNGWCRYFADAALFHSDV
jgi:hypothetical protein